MTAAPAPAAGGPSRIVAVSYNVHRCIGRDGRADCDRIAGVLREIAPDIVALQEVDSPRRHLDKLDQLEHLACATALQPVPGPTLLRHTGRYGNALLTRWPPLAVRRIDLKMPGREPRGALDVELAAPDGTVRVVATHLGLRAGERRAQIGALLRAVDEHEAPLTILLGDFNHWLPAFRSLRDLDRFFGRAAVLRTFPAWRPLFALDRVWVRPAQALLEVHVHATPLARTASDHLPVCATVSVGAAAAPAS